MPLDTPDDALALFEAGLALVKHPSTSYRGCAKRDLADHFFYLGAIHPEYALPLQERFVRLADDQLKVFLFGLHEWLYLLAGADDTCTAQLIEPVTTKPNDWVRRQMLAAIGTPLALASLATIARAHQLVSECEDSGIEIPGSGPAIPRFTRWRRAVRKRPHVAAPKKLAEKQNPIGLKLDAVCDHSDASKIGWHYLSVETAALEGIPAPSVDRLHLVSPPLNCGWTLFLHIRPDGKYAFLSVEQDEHFLNPDADERLNDLINDRKTDRGTAELLPFDDKLVYCNGNVMTTEGVLGVVGGPPIGLYPNPKCSSCQRLMFHVLTVTCFIREYGDGFRSLFVCEDCNIAACNGTPWN